MIASLTTDSIRTIWFIFPRSGGFPSLFSNAVVAARAMQVLVITLTVRTSLHALGELEHPTAHREWWMVTQEGCFLKLTAYFLFSFDTLLQAL